jgi:hypothetical protein
MDSVAVVSILLEAGCDEKCRKYFLKNTPPPKKKKKRKKS